MKKKSRDVLNACIVLIASMLLLWIFLKGNQSSETRNNKSDITIVSEGNMKAETLIFDYYNNIPECKPTLLNINPCIIMETERMGKGISIVRFESDRLMGVIMADSSKIRMYWKEFKRNE